MARRKTPRTPDAILYQLLAGAEPKTAFEADGVLNELRKAPSGRAPNADMYHRLAGDEVGNSHNGYSHKTVKIEAAGIDMRPSIRS